MHRTTRPTGKTHKNTLARSAFAFDAHECARALSYIYILYARNGYECRVCVHTFIKTSRDRARRPDFTDFARVPTRCALAAIFEMTHCILGGCVCVGGVRVYVNYSGFVCVWLLVVFWMGFFVGLCKKNSVDVWRMFIWKIQ